MVNLIFGSRDRIQAATDNDTHGDALGCAITGSAAGFAALQAARICIRQLKKLGGMSANGRHSRNETKSSSKGCGCRSVGSGAVEPPTRMNSRAFSAVSYLGRSDENTSVCALFSLSGILDEPQTWFDLEAAKDAEIKSSET